MDFPIGETSIPIYRYLIKCFLLPIETNGLEGNLRLKQCRIHGKQLSRDKLKPSITNLHTNQGTLI